jgi:hypothetical protein
MAQDGKTIIKFILIFLSVSLIVGYTGFQARNLIRGPQISLQSPYNGSTVQDALVKITGTAQNVTYITLNNRQIFVDGKGIFSEELLLSPGYNIWKLEAKDKFGRVVSKKIELVFNKT